MTRLPHSSGDRVVRALRKLGFRVIHQRGSHAMLVHERNPSRVAIVPVHKGRSIPPGTLRAILKGARLTVDELRDAL